MAMMFALLMFLPLFATYTGTCAHCMLLLPLLLFALVSAGVLALLIRRLVLVLPLPLHVAVVMVFLTTINRRDSSTVRFRARTRLDARFVQGPRYSLPPTRGALSLPGLFARPVLVPRRR